MKKGNLSNELISKEIGVKMYFSNPCTDSEELLKRPYVS